MDITSISLTDWIGYAAMLVLLISFMLKNIRNLRLVNSVGCLLFVIYGIMLKTSWPIMITNSAIILINIYYLSVKKN